MSLSSLPQNKKLSNGEAMAASLAGGILSAFVTLPIDVLVAQIQQASKAGQRVSVFKLFRDEFKAGGWERVAGFATRVREAHCQHLARSPPPSSSFRAHTLFGICRM